MVAVYCPIRVIVHLTKRLFTLLLSISCLAPAGQAFSRSFDDIIESGVLTVGVYRDFPPYSWQEDDKARGVDVEIARAVAKSFGVSLDIQWVTPDETLEDDLRNTIWKGHYLDRKVADIMMRVPYDREFSLKRDDVGLLVNELVVMTAPYQRERWQVVFNDQKLERVRTMGVFAYHPIGVEIDSLPAFYLTSAMGGRMRGKTQHFTTIFEAYDALLEDKVDAVMGLRGQTDWLMHDKPRKNFARGTNGFPNMGKQEWDLGIAVKTDFRQLGYETGDVIDALITSGEMEKIHAQFGLEYEKPGLYQDVN